MDKVLLHLPTLILPGIGAGGADLQLGKQTHNCYFNSTSAISFPSTTAISLAHLPNSA